MNYIKYLTNIIFKNNNKNINNNIEIIIQNDNKLSNDDNYLVPLKRTDNIKDLVYNYNISLNIDGNKKEEESKEMNDLKYQMLGDLGYSGSLDDRRLAFYKANGVVSNNE